MKAAPYLLAAALPFVAAIPAPVLDAAPSSPLVVELDDCECESILTFAPYQAGGSWDPWILSWSPDEGIQNGICSAESCEGGDEPRPCKGDFRIQVSWPQQPTPPCVTWAPVSYKAEGATGFKRIGDLDLSHVFVLIDDVGGDEVECLSEAETEEPMACEGDDTRSMIHVRCGTGPGTLLERFIWVRECCKTCVAE